MKRAALGDVCRTLVCFWVLMPGLAGTKQAATVRMLIRDLEYILHAGQTAELFCEFDMEDFDLFQNPIIWTKQQANEETKINIMGNILQPYIGTGRFSVVLSNNPPRYRLTLNIIDISLEDYGNYTCEVRGPQTTVLGTLTHKVYVKSPVRSITISDYNRTITDMDIQRTLVFTEGKRYSIHCISFGGCPTPQMSMFLGKYEITKQFSLDYTSDLSGVKGLRLIEHRMERWTDRFKVTAAYDNKILQCNVKVPEIESNIAIVKLRVFYAPMITCDKRQAFVRDVNVWLRCEVKAQPPAVTLLWTVDDNGTTISEGPPNNEYWTITHDETGKQNVVETRLYMKTAYQNRFKRYTLVAENKIGVTSYQVALLRKYKSAPSQHSVMQIVDPSATYSRKREGGYYYLPSPDNKSSSLNQRTHTLTRAVSIILTSLVVKHLLILT